MTYKSYFKGAILVPAILLPGLLLLDALYFSKPMEGGVEQFFLVYVLGFGLAAYTGFTIFAFRVIPKKSESEVLRLAWWSPVIFVPFYGLPWILYGVVCLLFGRLAGLGMMFMWLAYVPYVLVCGVLMSITSILLFKTFSKISLS
ncbi:MULTISPECIES: hypothetical protein [Pseudomonas syringae group]|nr:MULTISPECIES: hypothetical protein [Pseudomonas syringae group]MEE4083519.1 hypothetical protein [Pseudomonas viridiflava]QXG38064.1 hypothetical protein KTT61_13110 [Pseudomonas viridiflava]QXG41241.1 hypothetical protein KTT55_01640 [Pseudomonas viridiflava]